MGGKNDERVFAARRFSMFRPGDGRLFSRPSGALQICRAAPGGAFTGIAAFQAARMTSAFRRAPRVPFRTDEKEPKVRLRTLRLGRPARAAPGARYARRPLAGAPPRDPGLSPLRGPGPVGRILYKDGLRPNPLDPRAASGWPAAKVGGALPRINGRVFSIPPAAAPRAQCLCPRASGTVLRVRSGRHVRICVARSAHGEAENCAALPRTRARRANARNGRCFPPCVPDEPSGFGRWERPQLELSLQLVYPWGAAVTCGYWQGTPGGFLKGTGGSPLERPSSADFLGAQEVGPPAGAGPGNLRRRRRHIWSAPEGPRKNAPPGAARQIENQRAAKRARDSCRLESGNSRESWAARWAASFKPRWEGPG
mgnify:CR=1 FL=1